MRKPHQLATASSPTTALKWLLRVFIASYIFQINADTPNLKITVNSISWLQKHSTSKTGAGGGRASIKKIVIQTAERQYKIFTSRILAEYISKYLD